MKIASVTLAGNSADLIGDALRSVADQVDLCVLVDTRTLITDGTEDVARMVAGEKLRVFRTPWQDDFGVMRTAAMGFAATLRAEWAIWVDTDERIVAEPGAVRALVELAHPHPVDAISCWETSGEYCKERLLRLPLAGRYTGATHEYWDPLSQDHSRIARSQGKVRFWEVAKTEEQLLAKLDRDEPLLRASIAAEPKEPRWVYYLGDLLDVRAQHTADEDARIALKVAALEQFLTCANLGAGWGEMRAWAAFRAANLYIEGGNPDAARDIAGLGLGNRITAELFWVMAAAALVAGDYPEAIKAATHCAAAGKVRGYGQQIEHGSSGHVHPPAHYEGPYEILERAFAAQGRPELAADAAKQAAAAKAKREAA